MKRIIFWIEDEIKEKIRRIVFNENTTIKALVTALIVERIKRNEKK